MKQLIQDGIEHLKKGIDESKSLIELNSTKENYQPWKIVEETIRIEDATRWLRVFEELLKDNE